MITVYSKPACPQCNATYRYLKKAGLKYTSIDVTEDADAAEYVASLGYQSAPVVVVDDDHWGGFRIEKIAALSQQ
jgi:glutaredoxin-like protein NrdH